MEVEEIVPVGTFSSSEVHLPSIHVDRIVQGKNYEKRIEKKTVSDGADSVQLKPARERIGRRAALEFKDGM